MTIEEIRELERKVPMGRWYWIAVEQTGAVREVSLHGPKKVLCRCWNSEEETDEAKFIAASREAIPMLLSEIDRLTERLETEKDTRIKYQEIVYKICNLMDTRKTPSPDCTIDAVVDRVKNLTARLKDAESALKEIEYGYGFDASRYTAQQYFAKREREG